MLTFNVHLLNLMGCKLLHATKQVILNLIFAKTSMPKLFTLFVMQQTRCKHFEVFHLKHRTIFTLIIQVMKYIYSKIKLHIPQVNKARYTTKILGYSNYHEIVFDTSLLSKHMNRNNRIIQLYAKSSKIIIEQYVKFALSLLLV